MKARILVDADGCPVVDETIQLARRFGLSCVLFCDTSHEFQREGAETVVVSKGADSADFALVNQARRGDFVVTQDYGLAAMCLARGAIPLSQDGMVYDEQNIDALLQSRHAARKIRQSGGRLSGPKKRASKQDDAFIQTLTQLLEQAEQDERRTSSVHSNKQEAES